MSTCCIASLILIFLGQEITLLILFLIVSPKGSKSINVRSVAKGVIERVFLVTALANEYTQALVLFGALKLGTRLTDPKKAESGGYNDYFLIGNLLSVLSAIIFVYLYKKFL